MNPAACSKRGGVAYEESKLFTWPSAQLSLVHETELALLERGTFTLLLAHHSRSAHLVVVEASVGDVRWPVGKDSLVSYTAPPSSAAAADQYPASSCFLFALHLPSSHDQLTYQLLLFDHDHDYDQSSSSSHALQISKLQSLLALYATLQLQQPAAPTNPGLADNPLKELEEAAGEYWLARIDNKQMEAGQQEDAGAFEKQVEMESIDSQSSHGSSSITTSSAGVSKRMMKRMQKARRISAISKLFSKAVVRGLISTKAHIVHEAAESKPTISTDTKENGIKAAVANVEAITKVVEAVEGGLPQNMKQSTGIAAYDVRCGTVLDVSALATWTINELGLRLVLNAAVAANKSTQVASTGGAPHLYSVSSSCVTSGERHTGMSAAPAASTGKAVGGKVCRAGSNSSSSAQLSSLQSGSTDLASSGSPSARRPPRPPRRVEFLLNEVSSPISVNSGNSHSHIQK